jgi:rod shape-determining protein MreC
LSARHEKIFAGNWLVIDRGQSDGLVSGMPVIVDGKTLLGVVDDVFSRSARVLLATDAGNAVNAVDIETQSQGIVRGRYGLGMVMDTVLRSDAIHVGDRVMTSGLGGKFPRGLSIGTIESVAPSHDQLFQQATVSSSVSIRSLRTVWVILDKTSL